MKSKVKSQKEQIDIYRFMEYSPLHIAIIRNNLIQVKSLLAENDAFKNISKEFSPLILSTRLEDPSILKFLIKIGVDINEVMPISSINAIIMSIKHENMQNVEILLSAGCDPNIKQQDGETALILMAKRGRRLFLEKGFEHSKKLVDFSKSEINKWIDEQMVLESSIVSKLIKFGAKIDLNNRLGNDALFYAVESEQYKTVAVLLEAFGDNMDQTHLQTYLEHAKINDRQALISTIENFMLNQAALAIPAEGPNQSTASPSISRRL